MSAYCALCNHRLDSYTHAEECEQGIADSEDAAVKIGALKARAEKAEARVRELEGAAIRNDERHTAAMASVRKRAEHAEVLIAEAAAFVENAPWQRGGLALLQRLKRVAAPSACETQTPQPAGAGTTAVQPGVPFAGPVRPGGEAVKEGPSFRGGQDIPPHPNGPDQPDSATRDGGPRTGSAGEGASVSPPPICSPEALTEPASGYDAGLATAERIVRSLGLHYKRRGQNEIAEAVYDAADQVGSSIFTKPRESRPDYPWPKVSPTKTSAIARMLEQAWDEGFENALALRCEHANRTETAVPEKPVCEHCGEEDSDERIYGKVDCCQSCYAGLEYRIDQLTDILQRFVDGGRLSSLLLHCENAGIEQLDASEKEGTDNG